MGVWGRNLAGIFRREREGIRQESGGAPLFVFFAALSCRAYSMSAWQWNCGLPR